MDYLEKEFLINLSILPSPFLTLFILNTAYEQYKIKNKNSFFQFSLNIAIIKAVKEMGFNHPTPIQEKVIPHLISSDQDLIFAQTGTGKTHLACLYYLQLKFNFVQTLIMS